MKTIVPSILLSLLSSGEEQDVSSTSPSSVLSDVGRSNINKENSNENTPSASSSSSSSPWRPQWQSIVEALRGIPSLNDVDNNENKNVWSVEFDWPETVDRCDNLEQVAVLKHHYLNELCGSKQIQDGDSIDNVQELLKDYSPNAVIHEVMDNVPATYHGDEEGVRRSLRDVAHMLHQNNSNDNVNNRNDDDDTPPPKVEFQHVKINRNHAQVTWSAQTPQHSTFLFGSDSFTFDEHNLIQSQSIVAMSTLSSSKKDSEHEN